MSTTEQVAVKPSDNEAGLKPFTKMQLLNFCLGFFGLQFAWQMEIILSGPVTERLGASPFIFGLIWLAGPITGIVVQPIIGAFSDKIQTPFGKRRPFLLIGALLASVSLWAFPNSLEISNFLGKSFNLGMPEWSALLLAALFIWFIDASVNAAQGPYRALVPDNMPQEQHAIANSCLSFAIGLGSVIAAGTAPFLMWAFNYTMSIKAQFIMAALAFSLMTIWTCFTMKERSAQVKSEKHETTEQKHQDGFFEAMKLLFKASPEVTKICAVQFFTWIGMMSLFIFFTQFAIHTVYGVPDLANAADDVKELWSESSTLGASLSSTSFAVFNLICFIVSLPIGILSSRFGNKRVHAFCLIVMALAFIGMTKTISVNAIIVLMGLAGIGWASILALPFAIFSQYIPKGTEGSAMGMFNLFIAGPQILVCTLLAWVINHCPTVAGNNYHWEYAFMAGGAALFIAALITMTVKEKRA